MVQSIRNLAISLFVVICLSSPLLASSHGESDQVFQQLEQQLVIAEDRIQDGNLGPLSTRSLRQSIQEVIEQIEDVRKASELAATRADRLLAALGPVPEDGTEDETVATKRKELSAALALHSGRVKRVGLIIARAEQALSDMTRDSRTQFREYLLQEGRSPLSFSAWQIAIPEFLDLLVRSYVKAPAKWISELSRNADDSEAAIRYVLFSVAIALAGWPIRKWLLSRFGRRREITEPSYARRIVAACVEAIAHGLIPVLFVIGVTILFVNDLELGYELRIVVVSLARYLIIFFIGYGLIKAVFTPDLSTWRLTPLHTGASTRVVQRLHAVLVIFTAFGAIGQSLTWATPSEALESTYAFAYAIILYPALWALLRHRVWRRGGATPISSGDEEELDRSSTEGAAIDRTSLFWSRTRTLVSAGLLTIPAAAAAGYPKLTIFLIDASMLTGIAVAGLLALRWLGRSLFNGLLAGKRRASQRLLSTLDLKDEGRTRLLFWAYLILDLVLVLATVTLLLPLWGVSGEETFSWLGRLFRGVQIGSYTFSLFDIVLAIAFFAAIMLVTRLVQRAMERHFLPNVVKDVGVRDALRTGMGYVGVVIAALVGISTLGLDLSNLALIAGALSVGLGFGLQNIVSNFVSGLILLAERPIKPGDWIVVGGHEGTVKKVNVRSTEIETFQRASVIIPNADLIASPVTNWTHKNVLGRLEIRIGVAYGSDVDLVRDTLLELARAHPMVITQPEPAVVFADFGASSLDFELRCFLRDVAWVVVVGSELRFAINKAFAEKGIEIPFPQRVVHMASDQPSPTTTVSHESPLHDTERPTPDNVGGD